MSDRNQFIDHVWSSEKEVGLFLESLIELSSINTFLEVGTFMGYSTFSFISKLGKNFTSIDLEDQRPDFVKEEYEKYGSWFILNSSTITLEAFVKEGRKYGAIFIDTFHSYTQIKAEWEFAKDVVEKDGYIILHDSLSFQGITDFVNELKTQPNLEVITFRTPLYEGKKMSGLTVIRVM